MADSVTEQADPPHAPDVESDVTSVESDVLPDVASEVTAEAQIESEAEVADETEIEIDFEVLLPRVEAALLTSDRALTAGRLAEALELSASGPVKKAIDLLNTAYQETGRSFRIEEVAGGYSVMTLPQYADVLLALKRGKTSSRLSPAALETLSIIAYKQPVLRADIEAIRGVACGETLRSLMERHLVKITGRAEEIGRPMLYGTTKQFLEVFGLANLKDLPAVENSGVAR